MWNKASVDLLSPSEWNKKAKSASLTHTYTVIHKQSKHIRTVLMSNYFSFFKITNLVRIALNKSHNTSMGYNKQFKRNKVISKRILLFITSEHGSDLSRATILITMKVYNILCTVLHSQRQEKAASCTWHALVLLCLLPQLTKNSGQEAQRELLPVISSSVRDAYFCILNSYETWKRKGWICCVAQDTGSPPYFLTLFHRSSCLNKEDLSLAPELQTTVISCQSILSSQEGVTVGGIPWGWRIFSPYNWILFVTLYLIMYLMYKGALTTCTDVHQRKASFPLQMLSENYATQLWWQNKKSGWKSAR